MHSIMNAEEKDIKKEKGVKKKVNSTRKRFLLRSSYSVEHSSKRGASTACMPKKFHFPRLIQSDG